jgi:hypothetical protein
MLNQDTLRESLSDLINTNAPPKSWHHFFNNNGPTNTLSTIINYYNTKGQTPLYEATTKLNINTCKFLLKAGANPSALNLDGQPCSFGPVQPTNDTKKVIQFLETLQFFTYLPFYNDTTGLSVDDIIGSSQFNIKEQMGVPDYDSLPSTLYLRKINDYITYQQLPQINHNIKIVNSSIDDEIKNQHNSESFFVLPSQLNAVEYPHFSQESIVKNINQYYQDQTAGPIGQLCVNHKIGQYLLKYASNDYFPSGINAVKYITQKVNEKINQNYHWSLKNGYLSVPQINDKIVEALVIDILLNNINEYVTICMVNCPVIDHIHMVHLIYASAIPVNAYTNTYIDDYLCKVSNILLMANYYGSLKFALSYAKAKVTKTKIFLLPLGGGVFNNRPKDIMESIKYSIGTLIENYGEGDVNNFLDINLLTWANSKKEYKVYVSLL